MILPLAGIGIQSWAQSPVQALGARVEQVVDEDVERSARGGAQDRSCRGPHDSDDRRRVVDLSRSRR